MTSPPSAGLRPHSDPSRFHEKHPPRVGAFFAGLRPLVPIGGRLARRGGRRTLEELSAQRADATRLLPPPSRCSPGEDWSTVLPVRSLPLPASCVSAPGFLCFRSRLPVLPLPAFCVSAAGPVASAPGVLCFRHREQRTDDHAAGPANYSQQKPVSGRLARASVRCLPTSAASAVVSTKAQGWN